MITSVNNPQMKNVLALQKKPKTRYEQRVFVAEGIRLCFEAPKERVKKLYVAESFLEKGEFDRQLQEYEYEVVADSVLKGVSDTQTPQGILAVVEMRSYDIEHMFLNRNPLFLLTEGIQDPGNLGTMLRVGEAAGISGIIMDAHTVDLYNPKVVRGSMGSIFRVPFVVSSDFRQVLRSLRARGVTLFAARLEDSLSYEEASYAGPCGFLIGNEGKGLSREAVELADQAIRIPMSGQVESLNAAISATVLLYEARRQRKGN